MALTVAVVVGVGATPTVASHLTVRSSDIENGEVKTVDLDQGAVTKGKLAPQARVMWAVVQTTANQPEASQIVAQSGGISIIDPSLHSFVGDRLRFPRAVQGKAIVATAITSALGSPDGMSTVKVAPCGPGPFSGSEGSCGDPGSARELIAIAHNRSGDGTVSSTAGVAYYITVLP